MPLTDAEVSVALREYYAALEQVELTQRVEAQAIIRFDAARTEKEAAVQARASAQAALATARIKLRVNLRDL